MAIVGSTIPRLMLKNEPNWSSVAPWIIHIVDTGIYTLILTRQSHHKEYNISHLATFQQVRALNVPSNVQCLVPHPCTKRIDAKRCCPNNALAKILQHTTIVACQI